MKKGKRAPLTAEQVAELDALAAMPDSEIDTRPAFPKFESYQTALSSLWVQV